MPLTAKGDGSKELFVPPPPNLPPVLPDSRHRVCQGFMVLDRPDSRQDLESRRQIEFPDNITGRVHGDVIYLREVG